MGNKAAMTVAARLTQAAASFAVEAFGPIESNTSAAQPGSNTRRRLVLHAVAQWPAVHMRCVAGTAGTAALFLQCQDRCIFDQLSKNKRNIESPSALLSIWRCRSVCIILATVAVACVLQYHHARPAGLHGTLRGLRAPSLLLSPEPLSPPMERVEAASL